MTGFMRGKEMFDRGCGSYYSFCLLANPLKFLVNILRGLSRFITSSLSFLSFTAVFSPAKRRQLEQTLADSTPRRSILPRWSPGSDDDDGGGGGGFPQAGAAGYRKTNIIPVLKKTGKRQGWTPGWYQGVW